MFLFDGTGTNGGGEIKIKTPNIFSVLIYYFMLVKFHSRLE